MGACQCFDTWRAVSSNQASKRNLSTCQLRFTGFCIGSQKSISTTTNELVDSQNYLCNCNEITFQQEQNESDMLATASNIIIHPSHMNEMKPVQRSEVQTSIN